MNKVIAGTAFVLFSMLMLSAVGQAQWIENPATGSQPERVPDRTVLAGQSGMAPLMTAKLVNKNANAREHRAVVEVETDGVHMVDAASVNHVPNLEQAHIQYQLDSGDLINSTAKTMKFDGLAPGEHRIQVKLAGNDNKPIGKATTLKVHIP